MVGGACRSVGLVLLVVGTLCALVGAGLAATGLLQERGSPVDAAIRAAGGWAAAIGLASAMAGGLLLGVGSARRDRALLQAVLAGRLKG